MLHSRGTTPVTVAVGAEGSLALGRAGMGGFSAKPAPSALQAGLESASEGWDVP